MALQKTVTIEIDGGATSTIEDSYIKIVSFSGNKERLNILLGWFINKEAEKPFKTDNYHLTYDVNSASAVNPFAQVYEYLKTLPEFTDAVDI